MWDNRINVLKNYGVKYYGGINELYRKPKLLLIEFFRGVKAMLSLHTPLRQTVGMGVFLASALNKCRGVVSLIPRPL